MSEKKLVSIENTRFIFATNFAGDPSRDRFGSDARKVNIVIPDEMQADELASMGINVRQTKPREDEGDDFVPTYFVAANVNYDTKWPPKIYLVSGNAEPRELDEETVAILDTCYVKNVNAVLNVYYNTKNNRYSLYVRNMYVEQDVDRHMMQDPFRDRYFADVDEF